MSASGKKEPEEDGSQADNAEKLSISPKEDNRKAGENAAAENDEGEKARRQYEKIMLFVIGWFTVPFLTGGVWYDLFGGLDAGEVLLSMLAHYSLSLCISLNCLYYITYSVLCQYIFRTIFKFIFMCNKPGGMCQA